MPGNLKLQTGTHTQVQATGSSALSSGATVACATANIANGSNDDRRVSFVLNTGFGSTPTENTEMQLYLVPELDGSNFASVDTSTPNLPQNCYVGSFWVALAQTTAQIMTLEGVFIGPYTYKAYVLNLTGQQMSANWTLDAYGDQDQYT